MIKKLTAVEVGTVNKGHKKHHPGQFLPRYKLKLEKGFIGTTRPGCILVLLKLLQ